MATFPLKDNGQPSTFADIFRKLRVARILKMPEWVGFGVTFDTDAGEVTVSGDELFVLHVLRDLIELHKDGIDPHRAMWFYYEHDWSRDGDGLYEFFVLQDGKIVRERFSFMPGYPRVLTTTQSGC